MKNSVGLVLGALLVSLSIGPNSIAAQKKEGNASPAPSATPALELKWSPSSNMDAQLFPSLIIATASQRPDKDEKQDPDLLGDPYGAVGVGVTLPKPHAKVRVTLRENWAMNTSSWSGELEKAGTEYYVAPPVNYKFDQLRKTHQQVPLNVTFELEVDGKSVGEQHETITVHSINDCPYGVAASEETIAADGDEEGEEADDTDKESGKKPPTRSKSGLGEAVAQAAGDETVVSEESASEEETTSDAAEDDGSTDMGWMFAAYVNEGSSVVDKILKEALATKLVNHFAAYQGSSDDVLREVFAIWAALQARGIHYSSVTTTPGGTQTVYHQYVRFIEESLQNEQANCVDGSVLFASILRKLGMRTFLVTVPGHMYMGVYVSGKGDDRIAIETTMIGAGVSESEEQVKTIAPLRSLKATLDKKTRESAPWRTFEAAVTEGTHNLNNDRGKFDDQNNAEYQITDINEARRDGIMPIASE
ncbi:MAG: hypothetical protein ABR526_04885 [Chthoniobacterales bacterium]